MKTCAHPRTCTAPRCNCADGPDADTGPAWRGFAVSLALLALVVGVSLWGRG